MEVLKESMLSISKHISNIARSLNEKEILTFISAMQESNKIFIYGAGRSGLVAKAFAMRLMHLGFDIYVIGEIITPAIAKNDLLITISGSGETTSVVAAAEIAKKATAKVISITTYPNSTLGKIADSLVVVKGRTKLKGDKNFLLRQIKGEHYSLAPLGTLFEVAVLIFLDGLVAELMAKLGQSEDDLRTRHATIE
jgi:6-phospho 3-hexuloisomerase|tara:strand:+ start:1270 stop:1857 length:588 start_codon:yes stop_codon:yes gene_type:complete